MMQMLGANWAQTPQSRDPDHKAAAKNSRDAGEPPIELQLHSTPVTRVIASFPNRLRAFPAELLSQIMCVRNIRERIPAAALVCKTPHKVPEHQQGTTQNLYNGNLDGCVFGVRLS
jgi:hypothetical protein